MLREHIDDPERMAKALEDRADVTEQYDSVIWETARKNRLAGLFNSGQTDLTAFGYNIYYQGSADPLTSYEPVKSFQTHFKSTGGDIMTETHDSLDVDVQERPKRETKEAEIVDIVTGDREDFYDPNEDGGYEYGTASDPMVQLVYEYEHDGAELQGTETMRFYRNPDARSNMGKFISRWGKPETGMEVHVDFNEDGYGSIVLP